MKVLYRICLASILVLSVSPYVQGQNVGISSTTITPDAQAILELRATDKGVLLPRLTTSEAATLAGSLDANDDGMIIYDTVLKQFKYWDGSTLAWVVVATPTTVAGSTLDDAYDAGGSGTGRTITGDAGAMRIIGTGGTIALETDGDIQLTEDDAWIGSSPSLQRIRFDDNSGGRIHMEDADVNIDNQRWIGIDGSNARIEFDGTADELDIQDANIEIDAETWIGVGSSIERIEFQGSDNEINIMGATGGVGIGTLAPSNNLHIYDNTNSGIGITIENPNTTSTASSALIFDYAGAEYAGIYSRSENYSGANDYLQIINNHGAGSLIEMVTNGGSRMTIDDAGVVSLPSYSSGSSGLMVASTAGVLSKTDFSGSSSDVLTGDGNWSDISSIVSNDGDWTVSGNDIYNANSGNVGIGIAVPVTKLDVRGGDIGVQGDRAIVIGGNASAVPDNTPDAQLVLDGAHNTGHNLGGTKLLIRGFDNEANTKAISIVDEDANELFYIQSQATNNGQTYFKGNVGIGNTNPLNGLIVNMDEGAGSGYTGVGISGGASGNAKVELRGGTTPYIDFANDSGTDFDGRIRLTGDDQMALEGANLGIGITAPLEALHVNGNVRVSGLSAGGNVQADGSGNLIISNDIPGGDGDYIQNQNALDQAANFRISGDGQMDQVIATANGDWYMRGGDDHELRDVNVANTIGIWGRQNSDRAGIQLGSDNAYIFGDDGNIGIGNTAADFKLHVSGDIHPDGKFVVQNAVNGGNNRGIWMWNAADSNWGIYMGTSGGGLSLSGGTAVGGGGFTQHAIRTRVNNSATQGIIWENSAESLLYSVRGSDGQAYHKGNVGINTDPSAKLHILVEDDQNNDPADNGIFVQSNDNSGDNGDAIVTTRVAGGGGGDAFYSMDVSGITGWSMGLDNSDGDKLKFANAWNDPGTNTRMTIQTDGNVGIGSTAPGVKFAVNGNGTNVYSTDAWIENNMHVQGNETLNQGGRGRLRVGTAWGFVGLYTDASSTSANNDLVLGAGSGQVRIGPDGGGQQLKVGNLEGSGDRLVYANSTGVLQAGSSKKKYDVDVSSSLHPSYDDLSYTNILNSCSDDAIYTVNWGFNFTIDGVNYTEGRLSTNGILFFGNTGSTAYSNTALPTGITSNPALFFHWDDHAGFDFNYVVVGTAGARVCHIRWRADENISCGGNDMNFYITLHESSNTVSVRYYDMQENGPTRGNSATIGFQYAGGSSAEHITMGYNAELIDMNGNDQHFSLTFK